MFLFVFLIIRIFNYVFIYVDVSSACHVIKVNRLLDGVDGKGQNESVNLSQGMKVSHFKFGRTRWDLTEASGGIGAISGWVPCMFSVSFTLFCFGRL